MQELAAMPAFLKWTSLVLARKCSQECLFLVTHKKRMYYYRSMVAIKGTPPIVLAGAVRFGSIFLRKGLSGDAGQRIYGTVYKTHTDSTRVKAGKGEEPSELLRSRTKC